MHQGACLWQPCCAVSSRRTSLPELGASAFLQSCCVHPSLCWQHTSKRLSSLLAGRCSHPEQVSRRGPPSSSLFPRERSGLQGRWPGWSGSCSSSLPSSSFPRSSSRSCSIPAHAPRAGRAACALSQPAVRMRNLREEAALGTLWSCICTGLEQSWDGANPLTHSYSLMRKLR